MIPDIICQPVFFAPGFWKISALTSRGFRWWDQEQFPEVGWELGAESFTAHEVEAVVRALPDEMVIDVNGVVRRTEIVQLPLPGLEGANV